MCHQGSSQGKGDKIQCISGLGRNNETGKVELGGFRGLRRKNGRDDLTPIKLVPRMLIEGDLWTVLLI